MTGAALADRPGHDDDSGREGADMTGDKYRPLTALAVMLVAAIAAVVSYMHIVRLALAYGQEPVAAYMLPLSIDGMVAASSLVMLRAARAKVSAPWLARAGLVLAVTATLGANVAAGLRHGWPGALLSGWPAVAFVVSAETAISMSRRHGADTDTGEKADTGHAADMTGQPDASEPVTQPVTARPPGRSRRGQHAAASRSAGRSRADVEEAALAALSARPGVTGAELGRQLGVSERTGRRVLARLSSGDASSGAAGGLVSEEDPRGGGRDPRGPGLLHVVGEQQ